MKIYCSDREKGERNKQFNKNQTGCLLVSDLACGASGLAGGASGLAGWASGLAGWPSVGNKQMDKQTENLPIL